MKLQRIAIEEFKQFGARVVIDSLGPGLNVFTGPNEAGKSTIAEAVRTVFLERYKASHLKDLLPWGRASGQPTVEVSFVANGQSCTLTKQFVTRPRCNLKIGHEVFGEDEAEEKLALILGFSRAARGAMKDADAGVPGLLWVQQGQSQQIREAGSHAAQYLRDSLAQLSGSRQAGGEDALIEAVRGELAQLLTSRSQRATGALAQAEKELASARDEYASLEQQRGQFEGDTERLAALQQAFDEAQQKRAWETLESKAQDAHRRAAALAEMASSLNALDQSVQLREAELALSVQHETHAAELEASVAERRRQLERAEAQARQAQADHARVSLDMTRCQAAASEAARALELANVAGMARELDDQLQLYRVEIERLDASIGAAGLAHAAVVEATRAAASLEVDPQQLQRLRALARQADLLRAKVDAAMTRVEYRLRSPIRIGERSVEGEGVLRLDGAQTLVVPDCGELTIVPGISDLAALRAQCAELDAAQAQLLKALGVASLDDAETRHEAWKSQVAALQNQQTILALHAPRGIEALREARAAAQARSQTANERRAALPDAAGALTLEEARRAADLARAALDAAAAAQQRAADARASALTACESLADSLRRDEAQLASEEFRTRRAQWRAAIVEQRTHVEALEKQREALVRALEQARIDDPVQEEHRYRASAELAREEQHHRQVRIAALRSQLEAAGASGLGERAARAQAALERAQRRWAELSLRADALRLLERTLVEERDAAMAQLRAPLTERLGHYLRRFFPEAGMTLDDALGPLAVQRDGRLDALDALSFGTQEQMGIVTRLAYADVLKAAGRPTLLMLDDAAVHTDSVRRDALKRALLDAANRHQILLFTCHPELWNDLGVRHRSIDELKVAL
ncbi:AAA family ATPase [Trinickia caryophylli]|uniref:DNA repair exonuclease SbcCD ATPase subunit n=1 Tax=Trinickia caryophylli TaxID=28094 RepID=A0A1X7GI48_TRICW|nr:AAA family ATPase [Trinickia caryophylli]PMS09861.1 GTP-binding protein [Trinickia caryophylli]TRX14896.1 AAA family ATPase [Trinickia caryophylli]WQE14745.1 AAA family ATPase [Trinickia caryophylli]SMF70084.1 DNA repair exonuclease SbcCD ATPase subunit [Trinickia caryophylli]GLU34942.1 GTP-binding protein [Trinickia caryophylli]